MLLGCIFFFFPSFLFLLVECSFRAAIYSISIAYSFFFFSFFPPFLFFFGSFGCVQSGLLDYIGLFFFFPFLFSPFLFLLLGVFIRGSYK